MAFFMGPPPAAGEGDKLIAPSADRNKEPILETLTRLWPERLCDAPARILEVGCGTGQHAAFLSQRLPQPLLWMPTDVTDSMFGSVRAHCEGLSGIEAPRLVDASLGVRDGDPWGLPPASVDVVLSVNMVHIAPWDCAVGLFHGASHILRPGGKLFLYGPFKVDGVASPASNAEFDASLRGRNPAWGLRDIADCTAVAASVGLELTATVPVPANNFVLEWTRLALKLEK